MKTSEIKQEVNHQLRGNRGVIYGLTLIPIFVYTILNQIFSQNQLISLAISIVVIPIAMVVANNLLSIVRDEGFDFKEDFLQQISSNGVRYLLQNLLAGLFITLWTLLLIVPGIIAQFAYSFVPFISRDEPVLSFTEVIQKSRRLTKGHKWNLFKLHLRYVWPTLIGLVFLCVGFIGAFSMFIPGLEWFTLGIIGLLMFYVSFPLIIFGTIYGHPRWELAKAIYYERITSTDE